MRTAAQRDVEDEVLRLEECVDGTSACGPVGDRRAQVGDGEGGGVAGDGGGDAAAIEEPDAASHGH